MPKQQEFATEQKPNWSNFVKHKIQKIEKQGFFHIFSNRPSNPHNTTTIPIMKSSQPNTILLILAAICISIPSLSEAKGFKFYGQSFFSGSGGNECERSVESIEKLTKSILELYTEEVKERKECMDCKTLHRQIMEHKRLVDRLVKTSKLEDKTVFRDAAREVEASVRKMLVLKSKAEVSRKVDDMILKHNPLIARIKGCAGSFDVANK